MTALIATTIDTMTTTITSRAAIMEPKNRAASTSPITADAINRAASPALSRQNRPGGGERISCASGFRRKVHAPAPSPGGETDLNFRDYWGHPHPEGTQSGVREVSMKPTHS